MKDHFDAALDLELTRTIAARPETVWRCWTDPDLLMQWFCPKPWQVTRAVIDLRPGGRFHTRMEGPGGEGPDNDICKMDNEGCILDVAPGERLVFTDALREGWRPNGTAFMSCVMTLSPTEAGTLYRARVLHNDPDARCKHLDMGFEQGWSVAADQLQALAASL